MRAFQLVARQRPPEFREVPVPESGSGQILVKIRRCRRLPIRSSSNGVAGTTQANETAL